MPHPRFPSGEIARRGEEIYQTLRRQVETEANIGRIISIDIETGDFEIGDNPTLTARPLLERHEGAAIYGKRVGYNAAFAVGGTLTRVV